MNESVKAHLRGLKDEKKAEGLATIDRAEREGRNLTSAEQARVQTLIDEGMDLKRRIGQIEATEELRARIESDPLFHDTKDSPMTTKTVSPFAGSIIDAGFHYKMNPNVEVPFAKASTFPGGADLSRTEPGLAGLGQDSRWLFPHLPTSDVSGETAVQTFRQTGDRTVAGTVERAVDAVTDKATLGLTLTAVVEQLKQQAIIIDAVPNAVLEADDSIREFLNSEGKFQVYKSLDTHVMAQIVAAAPPFGTTGANLIERVRNGVASMQATGFDPNLVVVNPTDAAALDLQTDAGGYIFPSRDSGVSSPLWGLRVVVRIGAGTEPPYLIDTSAIGRLYIGNLSIQADPFAGAGGKNFARNLTDIRFELKSLFHVRQATGARRIAAA